MYTSILLTSKTESALVVQEPTFNSEDSVFSVYRTAQLIKLSPGCQDLAQARLVSTHNSYETAREFAELLAAQTGLPLEDSSDL